ncbi:MAG: dienelactone hydrolase family protein [Pyrinomonadaceae bacterium]
MIFSKKALVFFLTLIFTAGWQSSYSQKKSFELKEKRVVIENDGWKLIGDLQIPKSKTKVPAVILLNRAGGNRQAYERLVGQLARRGIATLRLDLRAHGESINKGKFGPPFDEKMRAMLVGSDTDVTVAFKYLESDPKMDAARIGFVGGSYSGEVMVESARKNKYGKAYVALSPGSFSDESMEAIDGSGIPWFFVKSVDEIALMKEVFADLREKSKTAQILEVGGKEHASGILGDHPELNEMIAVWFKNKL